MANGRRSPGDGASTTLGAQVAARLEQEARATGWRVGHALGSEAELTERFGVGVAAVREAARILATRGIARSRRGPGGGLFVIAPDRQMVTDVARLYLERTGVDRGELFDAWCALELSVVAHLAVTIDADGAATLRTVLARYRTRTVPLLSGAELAAVHLEIARLAGNAVLELFIRTVAELAIGSRLAVDRRAAVWWHEVHAEFVEAIISGEVELAQLFLGRLIQRFKLQVTAVVAAGRPGS